MRSRGRIQASRLAAALLIFAGGGPVDVAASAEAGTWPSFRGPQARGVADGYPAPEQWNLESGENVAWRTPVPGLGHSSPVIWEERLFVTSALSEGTAPELRVGLYGDIAPVSERVPHRWLVYCLDKGTGKILWEKVAREGVPRVQRHPKSTHANSTAATDGRRVVCFFGSEGLFCLEFSGRLLWQKDFGTLDSGFFAVPGAQWGFGSSPIIHSNRVIVQCDVQTNSFLAAFALEDGRELWRAARSDVPTWSTPTVDVRTGRAQVIVNGFRHSGGYDLETGRELWKLSGGGDIPVPTPITAGELIYLTSAHGRLAPIYAIRSEAAGDISLSANEATNRFVAWSLSRRGNYMQTPIVYGREFYACNDAGVVACYDARTGQEFYRERLGSGGMGFTASPVAAEGKLYYASEPGTVFIVRAGRTFELLGRNELGETCLATPALSEGTLFFRTRHHLVAIREGAVGR